MISIKFCCQCEFITLMAIIYKFGYTAQNSHSLARMRPLILMKKILLNLIFKNPNSFLHRPSYFANPVPTSLSENRVEKTADLTQIYNLFFRTNLAISKYYEN